MMKDLLRIAFVVLWTAVTSGQAATFYVATNGNDQWSGTIAQAAADGKDGPLASLPAALIMARKLPAAEGKTIVLRGGTYQVTSPISLTPQDSGTDNKRPLVIQAYRDEKPEITGGRRIRGWTRAAGKPGLWQADIPALREGKWYFRQLFINGERRQRARSPNEGFFRIQGASPQDKPVKIKFKPGDIKKKWADEGDVELIALLAWADLRMQIRTVDETNHVATLSGNARPSNKEDNAQYYVENAPDALDQPGEWYLDKRRGVLTYWPKPGEDMTSAEVIAPELQEMMVLQGDLAAKRPVHNIVIRGLTFNYTDWSLAPTGYADTQAAIGIRGNIRAEGAVDCAIEGCTFSHLAGYGIELGRGCQDIKISRNEIFDLGAGGIRIGETRIRQEPSEQTHDTLVTDNHLHHLGEIYPSAIGVLILQSGTNRVAYNEIDHLYYTAVSVGWTWGYQQSPCRENRVEFNHMHDIGQFRLSDMGAVYTLGPQPGTVIGNNLIHDVNAHTYGGWGLYTDEGSSGILLENNVVYRCKSAGFHQHYGRENIVRNNVFAFGKENQLMRTRPEPHVSFIFTNNIVYFGSGNLLGSDWSNDHYEMDHNVYFDIRKRTSPESLKFAGGSFEAWQKRGHDQHSIIADPLFVDPEKNDFRLRPESPVMKLGFKPLDLSRVGVGPK
jgi:parallel beta-helix repeat protein